MADETFAGPVDYLVFAFPAGAPVGPGLRAVLDRVDAGVIDVLDLEVIAPDAEGHPVTLPLADLRAVAEADLSAFEGVDSGILDPDDLSAIVEALAPDQFAIAIVYEDRSLAAAADAWARAGGAELFSGGVDIDDLRDVVEGVAR